MRMSRKRFYQAWALAVLALVITSGSMCVQYEYRHVFTVLVVDEEGKPVPETDIIVGVGKKRKIGGVYQVVDGKWAKVPKPYKMRARTDKDGKFFFDVRVNIFRTAKFRPFWVQIRKDGYTSGWKKISGEETMLSRGTSRDTRYRYTIPAEYPKDYKLFVCKMILKGKKKWKR